MDEHPGISAGRPFFRQLRGLLPAFVLLGALLANGNVALAQVGDPPTVALVGANPQLILQGGSYTELGATASDLEDGDLTGAVVITGVGSINLNAPGNYTVTYTVTDSDDNTVDVTRTVTVTPNNPPTINLVGANPQLILQGNPYAELGATASDPQDGNLTGAIVISGVGSININAPGNYTVTYTVTDSDDNTVNVTRTVTVTPNNPPTITLVGANPQLIPVGGSYNELGATASDPQDGNLTGAIVISGVGSINVNVPGDYIVTYTVTDSDDNTATVNRTVRVTNSPPVAVADSYSTAEDTTLNVAAPGVLGNDTDPDPGTTLTAVLNTNVANGTLTLNANGSFSYVPNANFSGADSFTYRASDGSLLSNVVTVSITVTAVNDAPVAVANSYSTAEDTTLNVAAPGVLGNDTDPDTGTTLTAVLNANVANGTLTLNPNGSFSYVPNANFNGADSFTYHASDGSLSSNVVTVSITVTAVNDAPVAVADSYSTAEDTTLNVAAPGVLGNDTDPETGTTLTAVLNTNVANGTLTLNANGSFAYTPNLNFNGADSFTYRANDGSLSSTAVTVTITVSSVNDPPFVTSTPQAAVNEKTAYSYTVTATDPDGDPLTFAAPTLPSWLVFTAPATISGTPSPADAGVHAVTMTVSDGTPPAVQHSFQITVNAVDDAPVVTPIPDQFATELVAFSLNLGDFVSDEDTQPNNLVYAATSALPAGLTLSATGVLSGTPLLLLSVGDFSVSFTVSDGTTSVPGSFNLTVLRAGRADLAVTVTAAPNPVALNATATWTFAITNNAPQVEVGSYLLEAVFSGDVPFQFAAPASGCTIAPSGTVTNVSCTLGPLAGGATATVALSGSGNFAGDVFATATVSIAGPVPIDETPRNDTASGSLSVAQAVSTTPAQAIGGLDARAVAAGDLNGDGFIDLVVATGPSQSSVVLLNVVDPNNANKRALSDAPISLGDQATNNGIVLADLDGDSDLDIVTATGPGAANRIFLNSGSATFTALALGDPSDNSHAVAAGDIDGDLLTDLVFANGSPNPVYTNRSGGVFARTGLLGNADSRGVVLVDLFGDPLPELVFANADGNATVYRNSGGVFQLELSLPTGPTTSVAAADFNNDGRVDLVFGRRTGATPAAVPSNLVWLNTSSATGGSFFLADELGAAPTAAVAVADINLDGNVDILTINDAGAHQLYTNVGGTGSAFALHPQQIASAGALGVAVAALSVDARVDAALVGPNGVAVFYNDGSGNLGSGDITAPTIQLRGEPSITLTVEDGYSDAGATAMDTIDGDVTTRIVVTNPVNPAVIGTYTVTYNATDLSGNSAAPVTRTVRVQARQGTGGGGGGAAGLEFALWLAFVTVLSRLGPRWRLRSKAS